MATSDEAVKEKAQFYRSAKSVTLYEGTVRGEGGKGSFLHYDESLAKMPLVSRLSQQPTFYPSRLDWTHWEDKGADRPELGSPSSIQSWVETVKPHPDFSTKDFGVWKEHCADLWDLLTKLQDDEMSTNFGLIAFLRTMTYGIRDLVAVAPHSLNLDNQSLKTNKWGRKLYSSKLMKEGVLVTKNRPMLGFRPIRETMFNRRYLIGITNFGNWKHWVAYIWDATKAQLFLFDTLDNGKEERFRALGVAWREVMTLNGTPYDFTVFGMPASTQSGGWECGYLAVFLVTLAIRGMVGLDKQQMAGGIPRQRLTFDDEKDKPDGVPFELRFRDWKLGAFKPKPLPKPKTKGKVAKKKEAVEAAEAVDLDLERVKSFIGCAIMEELGVRDLMYSEGPDEGNRKITLSHDYTHQLMPADQKLRTSDLYTSLGGFTPINWRGLEEKKLPDSYRLIRHPAAPFGQTFCRTSMYQSDYRRTKFTMPDNLVKMFTERGFEVQKGIPKLPGTTGGSVVSLDSSAPEEIAAPTTAPVLAPAPGKAPSIAKTVKPVKSVNEPAKSVVESVKSASREEKGKLSSLMEGVKTIETSPKTSPTPQPAESDLSTMAGVFSGSYGGYGSDVSMRDAREGSAVSDISMRDTDEDSAVMRDTRMRDASPSPPPRRQGTRTHRTPTVSTAQFIEGATPYYVNDDVVAEGRRNFADVTIGDAAKKMTIDTDLMNLPRIPNRPTLFMPKSKTYATFIPEGLISLSQWDDLIDAAYTDVIPPAIAKISREERYRQREARK